MESIDALRNPEKFFSGLEGFSRNDYLEFLSEKKFLTDFSEFAENEELILAVHQHWHKKAHQGCHFAAVLAGHRSLSPKYNGIYPKSDKPFGWHIQPYQIEETGIISENFLNEIRKDILDAANEDGIFSLSLLFPSITNTKGLVGLIKSLVSIDLFSFDDENESLDLVATKDSPELISLGMRVQLTSKENKPIKSYALGFGPFDYFGATRRSPITEVVFMVKEKNLPPPYWRLKDNPTYVHLADHPLNIGLEDLEAEEAKRKMDTFYDRLWSVTQRKKRTILTGRDVREGEDLEAIDERLPSHIKYSSKAKTTFAVPLNRWNI